ncbi:MAG: toll/interleukin-1 receptor domain-containing protein [Ginsengibacter sp.]
MFITIQFPLFDYRYMKADPRRTEKPNWSDAGRNGNNRVRYFGEIFDRKTPYLGPWDDEKKYCNAKSVINLCGLGEKEFYKSLYTSPSKSRILFRRFQSDGKCLAKFEVGLNDSFEYSLSQKKLNAENTATAIYEQITKYLLCPAKIKVGNKLTPFSPMINSGNFLKAAYYWATARGKKSFDPKDIHDEVISCEPVLLVQLDTSTIDISSMRFEKVEMPGLAENKIKLYCQYLPFKINDKNYNLKTWFICSEGKDNANPILPNDFQNYSNTIRYLRINLLRIHTEIILQKNLLEVFSSVNDTFKIKDEATKERLYFYLHKIWLNLSSIKRNQQPQQQLIATTFRLNESYFGASGIDEQLLALKDFSDWLKNLKITPENEQVKKYVGDNSAALESKKADAAKEISVFISYNHNDGEIAELIKQKLANEKIIVILDSDAMLAGTAIDDFITASIKNTNATVSIISNNSLNSGWVSIETINTISFKTFFPGKKFIPCYTDKIFLENEFFVDDTQKAIDKKIEDLKIRIQQRQGDSSDLDEKKKRLIALRNNLPVLINYLNNNFCLDFTPAKLESNFAALLKAIKS